MPGWIAAERTMFACPELVRALRARTVSAWVTFSRTAPS